MPSTPLSLDDALHAAHAGDRLLARLLFEELAEQQPDDLTIRFWLAWLAETPAKAQQLLRQTAVQNPGHGVAHGALHWLETLLGERVPPGPAAASTTSPGLLPPANGTIVEFRAACPACEAQLVVRATALGQNRRCPACLMLFQIPLATANHLYQPRSNVAFVEPQSPVFSAPQRSDSNADSAMDHFSSESIFDEGPVPSRAVSAAMSSVFLWKNVAAEIPREEITLQAIPETDPVPRPAAIAFADTKIPSPISAATHSLPESAGGRILLVDDSAALRSVAGNLLRQKGYEVDAVASGEQALAWVEDKLPQLIVLDVVLPGLDGYEVCRRLRQNPQTRGVPVILLSSKTGFMDQVQGRLAGCTVYMSKPCEADLLCDTVRNYLSTSP